ncbi:MULTISPECIES: ABC transporter ATP-binding protein [Micrococcus]|uniref:ABC transporter ATP-binding protein n=1 Tax=Micrococcus TaxID=1269 RepID=UPI00080DAA40|nr:MULTISPECIES: ABC transporter ATP-binding protein [Micrococcus]MBF0755235.1 ABC transporter ATP-binding protein [Micrococcus aloeverae]MBS9538430.1 ABC transporter ATP-binding protein [Micrococcus luteus]TFU83585.1 ABC transporter ATP-binding protein [Micrococcus aloeverae]
MNDAPLTPPVLTARGLTKSYGPTRALAGVDLAIRPGESVAVMGPSGSGKTTLLHVLSGIIVPDAGQVTLAGADGTRHELTGLNEEHRARLRRERLGFVFQEGLLLPELTARENVAMPLMLNGAHRKAAEQTAARWLESLGLAGMGDRRPGELSGGQRQRVAIARAQAVEPDVVFADEPTGALDSDTSDAVLASLISSTVSRGRTLVVVTHDPSVAAACSRLVRVRDGRIESDTAQRPAQPASEGTVR